LTQPKPLAKPLATPLIGIPACRKYIHPHWFHCVGEKYSSAIVAAAGGVPVMIPALGNGLDQRPLLAGLDGLFLTGSPSNLEPHHYGGEASLPGTPHDPWRDATTLPLIKAAIAGEVPLLAVCRGFQELNVACGGSLYQRVQEVAGFDDHRENTSQPLEQQYGPAHRVRLCAGGVLHRLAGSDEVEVNSLHGQGLHRPGEGLIVEATAPDGLVEAVRVEGARFALGVQWHPEWRVLDNDFSSALFRAFGDACRQRALHKTEKYRHEHHRQVV